MTGLRLDGRHCVSVILVIVAFLLAACGSPEPTATPTAEPEATKAPAAATSPPAATSAPAPTNTPPPTVTPIPAIIVVPTNTPIPQPTPRPIIDLSAQGQNLPPHIFIGTARIDGNLVPRDTMVLAFIGETEVGGGVVGSDGKYPAILIGHLGQTVTFTVGGLVADQTAVTMMGGAEVLDLTASSR